MAAGILSPRTRKTLALLTPLFQGRRQAASLAAGEPQAGRGPGAPVGPVPDVPVDRGPRTPEDCEPSTPDLWLGGLRLGS